MDTFDDAATQDMVPVPRELLEKLIEHAQEKLAYVLSAYGSTFRNRANELEADIAAAKVALLAASEEKKP